MTTIEPFSKTLQGHIYNGEALHEVTSVYHFMTTSENDALNEIHNLIEESKKKGYKVLATQIDVTKYLWGVYNKYTVQIWHVPPETHKMMNSMQIELIPLLPSIIQLVGLIVGLILAYFILDKLEKISWKGISAIAIVGVAVVAVVLARENKSVKGLIG